MTAGTERDDRRILLDWVTVRYRTVWMTTGLLVAVAVAVVIGIFWVQGKDRRSALMEIEAAEEMRAEAEFYAEQQERLQKKLADAVGKLSESREAFDRQDYDTAKTDAIVSQGQFQTIMEVGRGEKTAYREVRFARVDGDVKVKRAGQFHWEAADQKRPLQIGDQIKTARGAGAKIVYSDGSQTTIKPGSLLEIKNISEERSTKRRKLQENLKWGAVEARSRKHEAEGSFREIATDTTVTRTSDESTFEVSADENSGDSKVTVVSGRVDLSAGGQTISLSERQRVQVKNRKIGTVEDLPVSPRLVQPPDQRVFTYPDPDSAQTVLVWNKVNEARRYRLQVSASPLFTDYLVDNEKIESTSVELAGLAPAGYYWRVAAIDGKGRTSTYSSARKFRITSAQLDETSDTVPPVLSVEDFVQNGPIVIITGSTEPGATVWVDNERVDINDTGEFTAVVRLRRDGRNRIRLVAQDGAGNETAKAIEAFVEVF